MDKSRGPAMFCISSAVEGHRRGRLRTSCGRQARRSWAPLSLWDGRQQQRGEFMKQCSDIYIDITYIYAYMYICILCHMCIYIHIYRHAQVHVLSMYNVCSVYIYIYICIRLNYIIYIDSEYLHYTYNTIYTIHSAQYTVQNTQNAIRNMQCARQDITSNTYFRMILQ